MESLTSMDPDAKSVTASSLLDSRFDAPKAMTLAGSRMDRLNDLLSARIEANASDDADDATVSKIHDLITFYRNSVNVVIGRRGSGKTFSVLREVLKLVELDPSEGHFHYSQIFYVTDKAMDDTVAKFRDLFPPTLQFIWMKTSKALNLLEDLGSLKAKLKNPSFEIPKDVRKFYHLEDTVEDAARMLNWNTDALPQLPHSLVIFDDCLATFSKTTPLAKKLYENRQIRATIFLMLQDVTGLSPSMKSNVNALQLFGGYSRQKFNVLFYQLPPVETTYDSYKVLDVRDSIWFNFETGEEIDLLRPTLM